MFRSTRVSTLQAYHGAVASPVMHALTARQLLVVARGSRACSSQLRERMAKNDPRLAALAGWRAGGSGAKRLPWQFRQSSRASTIARGSRHLGSCDRTRRKGASKRVETALRLPWEPFRARPAPTAAARTMPAARFRKATCSKTRFWHEESSHPRRHRGKTPDDTRPRPLETRRPTSKTRRPKRSRLPKPRFCCTRRAERAERSGPKPISIPAPFMRVRPSAWLWHSDFDTNFDQNALHEGATSSFGSAALSQSNFNPRTLHGGV